MKKLQDLKTFEDACEIEGLDPKKVIPDFSCYPEKDRNAMVAHAKLVIIASAANRLANSGHSWKPDWANGKWDKYYPWFKMGGSYGFRFDGPDIWNTGSSASSRLCFISHDVAAYIGKQFIELYREYFAI